MCSPGGGQRVFPAHSKTTLRVGTIAAWGRFSPKRRSPKPIDFKHIYGHPDWGAASYLPPATFVPTRESPPRPIRAFSTTEIRPPNALQREGNFDSVGSLCPRGPSLVARTTFLYAGVVPIVSRERRGSPPRVIHPKHRLCVALAPAETRRGPKRSAIGAHGTDATSAIRDASSSPPNRIAPSHCEARNQPGRTRTWTTSARDRVRSVSSAR